jgi:hypothetical protein
MNVNELVKDLIECDGKINLYENFDKIAMI